MLHDIPVELLDELKRLVKFHHSNYVVLFEDTLKPKHHNIVHYATAINMSGSLRRQWGMRCEAKHKEAKQYCRVNCNKRNMCASLISKFSFKYAFEVFKDDFLSPFIVIKNENKYNGQPPDICKPLMDYITSRGSKSFQILSKFTKQNSLYEKGTIFCVRKKLMRNVYEIEAIILREDTDIILFCYPFSSTKFDEHLQSFVLVKQDILKIIMNIEKIDSKPINVHNVNENVYLRMCNFVSINSPITGTLAE